MWPSWLEYPEISSLSVFGDECDYSGMLQFTRSRARTNFVNQPIENRLLMETDQVYSVLARNQLRAIRCFYGTNALF